MTSGEVERKSVDIFSGAAFQVVVTRPYVVLTFSRNILIYQGKGGLRPCWSQPNDDVMVGLQQSVEAENYPRRVSARVTQHEEL